MIQIEELKQFKQKRQFVPKNFKVKSWPTLKCFFDRLLDAEFESKDSFENWMKQWTELEGIIDEDLAWRYIKMTTDTTNENYEKSYSDFIQNIDPEYQKSCNAVFKKISASPVPININTKDYTVYLRNVRSSIEIFEEKNIPLNTKEQLLEKEYGEIAGGMMVIYNDQEYTMPQAANFLKKTDRSIRKDVWLLMNERRHNDKDKLDDLLTDLIGLRHNISINAGFENYRDYKFKALKRFDYDHKDCLLFHESCKTLVIPLIEQLNEYRKEKLGINELFPWDLSIDIEGKEALRSFEKENTFIDKAIACFNEIDPFFGSCLSTMRDLGYLDLFSRKGKAPGGYNYPLNEIGVPFIFMNAAGSIDDITTLVHEGGHVIHSFLTRDIPIVPFRGAPMEVSEVASMAMELISMEHWHHFFPEKKDLRRAKIYQLERVLSVLPWIAQVDAFQHWLYLNHTHSFEERKEKWIALNYSFSPKNTNRDSTEKYAAFSWQKQLHIYEVPFYYIEYGIAQLGAIGLWKQYKENSEKALMNYKKMLKLGNRETIPNLYKAAGLEFDFSADHIRGLCAFVKNELEKIL